MTKVIIERLIKSNMVYFAWKILGSPLPPPHIVKQKAVKKYAHFFRLDTLVETGTYLGDMVYASKNSFEQIYSIELSPYYFKLTKERFKHHKNIQIIKGDSSKELKKILTKVKKPVLFWLDGHYSSAKTAKGKLNTPIVAELNSILKHSIKSHVILIDDARHFTGKDDYPKLSSIKKLVAKNYKMEVKNDIIHLTPKVTS